MKQFFLDMEVYTIMEREYYSSYNMNDNIRIVVDDNPDDIEREGLHCHAVKVHRGRVAFICLPSCRFNKAPKKDDLSYMEQNKVLKFCESIKDQLITDCRAVLKKNKKK